MTVKTHKEYGAQCTQTAVAPLVDVVTTIPFFGYAGAVIMWARALAWDL